MAYAAQMPLDSISEDINSSYFASSNSNMGSYINMQKTENISRSPLTKEGERNSGSSESQENYTNDKINNTVVPTHSTITISDNLTDNAPVDTLEQKLNKILQKRNKVRFTLAIFINYRELRFLKVI
jgi:hypothetical protein